MMNLIKHKAKAVLELYQKRTCRIEFEQQTFGRLNERPVEYAFLFKHLARAYPRKILDIGTGTTALPHLMRNCGFHVTATDNVRDYWPAGMLNRHYHVIHDDITDSKLSETFDFITCISVLEHIERFDDAVRNIFSLLNPSGHLLLTFPYTENAFVRNVYEMDGSSYGQHLPYICRSYSRKEVDTWLRDNHGSILEQEYWQFWDGDFWTAGPPVIPPREVNVSEKHQISCILIRKNG